MTHLLVALLATLAVEMCNSGAVQLDSANIDGILANNELVLINFYADWCRFSNMLKPIWDEGADKIAAELPDKKVVMGKVDCDKETTLGSKFHITKYPTIKFVQNGVVAKKEYRGQRSADSFLSFVKEHVKDPLTEFTSLDQLDSLDSKKRHLIGYFPSNSGPEYENFRKVAVALKEDCSVQAGFGLMAESVNSGDPQITFRPSSASSSEPSIFTGSLTDEEALQTWARERCSPLVREITFENAEELTEEGLPFLILFHHPDDTTSTKEYTDLVTNELLSEKSSVNFLTADGLKFAHPLHHLGKSRADLPLIAIDSFRHMYLFPRFEDIRTPGKVKSFLQDLYNGKLHREFHYGPDPKEEKKEEEKKEETGEKSESENETDAESGEATKDESKHIPRTDDEKEAESSSKKEVKSTSDPPESQFVHLGPSKNRYTILRDEF